MMRVLFPTTMALAVLAACNPGPANQPAPNVLLIMVDDMGYGDIGMSGNQYLSTPNLEAFAAQSVSFSRFYVSPVCAPTRASLLTGRYHQRTGVRSVTNGHETMNPDEVTMGEVFSDAGYKTGLFGKWHLGETYPSLPNEQGFQEFIGFRTGHTDKYFDQTLEHNGEPYPTTGYITDVLTDEAIRFMKNAGDSFLCYLPFNAPHTPLDVPDRYLAKFEDLDLNERVARVYAMIEAIDYNIGRLVKFLRESELEQNTVIIFLSDNGPIDGFRVGPAQWRYNSGLRDQKFSVYEGGIRSRFFVRWTGRIKPHVVDRIAAHIDVLPTLMDICGIQSRTLPVDGVSLAPLLFSENPLNWQDRTLYENYSLSTLDSPAPYPGGIAIAQRYKMIDGRELYDLEKDPGESTNLAEELPDVLTSLDEAYRSWWVASMPLGGFKILPVGVGFAPDMPVRLTPHLGRAAGELVFNGFRGLHSAATRVGRHPTGVDGDWMANWHTQTDTLIWTIDAKHAGMYQVDMSVRAAVSGKPSLTIVSGSQTLRADISSTGKAEGEMTTLPVGAIRLDKGVQKLKVTPSATIPEGDDIELGALILTFVQPTEK